MRFHWGLAVGHTYTHDSTLAEVFVATEEHFDDVPDVEESHQDSQLHVPSVNMSEFSLNEHENHDWDNPEEEGERGSEINDEGSDLGTDSL